MSAYEAPSENPATATAAEAKGCAAEEVVQRSVHRRRVDVGSPLQHRPGGAKAGGRQHHQAEPVGAEAEQVQGVACLPAGAVQGHHESAYRTGGHMQQSRSAVIQGRWWSRRGDTGFSVPARGQAVRFSRELLIAGQLPPHISNR